MATDRIETLLDEQRRFPPPASFTAQATCATRAGAPGPGRLLGGLGEATGVEPALGPRAGVEAAPCQVVPRRQAQRIGELPRPPRARGKERPHRADLGGRAAR